MGVAACLLLEYGVSTAAVAVGWSGYLNEALGNITGFELPQAILGRAVGRRSGHHQPAGRDPRRAVHAPADPGRERVGQGQRDHGRDQAGRAGDVLVIALHRPSTPTTSPASRPGVGRRGHRGRHDLLLVHRSGRGVHRRRRGEGPAEDDAARAPRRAVHRHRHLRAGGDRRRCGAQPWPEFEGQSEAGLAKILENITGSRVGHDPRPRRRHLDLLGHPGDAVRPDPHPVRDGPRRHAAATSSHASARARRRR